eukprot:7413934-Pyramimonas_sp.AAC.1
MMPSPLATAVNMEREAMPTFHSIQLDHATTCPLSTLMVSPGCSRYTTTPPYELQRGRERGVNMDGHQGDHASNSEG